MKKYKKEFTRVDLSIYKDYFKEKPEFGLCDFLSIPLFDNSKNKIRRKKIKNLLKELMISYVNKGLVYLCPTNSIRHHRTQSDFDLVFKFSEFNSQDEIIEFRETLLLFLMLMEEADLYIEPKESENEND